MDDFSSFDIASYIVLADHPWYDTASYISIASLVAASSIEQGGVLQVKSTAAIKVELHVDGSDVSLPFVQSKNPTVRMRIAQYGSSAGNRRIGLTDAVLNADPTNGIFIRWAVGGHYYGVCRSGGVESTLDLGVAAADGTFHNIDFIVTGTTSVQFLVNGVSQGTITAHIPTASLFFGMGYDASTASNGLYVNYIQVVQNR